ncbi:MAG: hypothetical protein AABX07_06075 [Nanoarchaeota archaeon]
MDNCITCSSLRCSSPDRKLRTKCAASYAVFCIFLMFALAFVLSASNAMAIGITPGRTTLDFKPSMQKDIEVTVINSQKADIVLSVGVQGELKDSILLKQKEIKMSSKEEEKNLAFSINLPRTLSPGLHTAEVVVTQPSGKSANGQANLGADLAVATQIAVYVPYPGQYIEAQLAVSGSENQKNFGVSMINRGSEKIQKVKATIEIFDASKKKVGEIETNSISLNPAQKGEVAASWNANVPSGKYNAKAIINYDNKEIYVENNFEVGEFVLDLLQIYVKDFKLGGIAKFNMLVKNKWNEPITKAYAEMRVLDKDMHEIADVKSSTYDIPSQMQTEMVYYWDTKGINVSVYNANVILYYAEKKTQQDLKLDVKQDSINVIGLGYVISSESSSKSSGLTTMLIIIIGFLVLLNLLWFLILRKKKMRR